MVPLAHPWNVLSSSARLTDTPHQDIPVYGNPPIRQAPAGPDKQRFGGEQPTEMTALSSHRHHHHHPHLHLSSHRRTRSKDDGVKPPPPVPKVSPVRSIAYRENAVNNAKRLPNLPPSAMSSSTTLAERDRPLSPPPLTQVSSREAPSLKQPTTAKRSFFDKLISKKGNRHNHETESLKSVPGGVKSQDPRGAKNNKAGKDPVVMGHVRIKDGSMSSLDGNPNRIEHGLESADSRKQSGGKGSSGGKPKRLKRYDTGGSKDFTNQEPAESSLFSLDTDLTDMDGIVSQQPPMTPPDGGIFTGLAVEDGRRPEERDANGAEWNAPDSWAVRRRGDENMTRLREIDEAGVPPKDADDGTPYCVRIFRIDSTFATLSAGLNSTVDELLRQLGKKSFLQDDLENYQIVMRKHDLQRILESGERPIAIQKRLLEQAGYMEADRLDEIGREDNSYLCRFTFVPTRLSGYYSLVGQFSDASTFC